MNLGVIGTSLGSNTFQNGSVAFNNGFDSGKESFPIAGSRGQNNPLNQANQRANRTFVALHHRTPNDEQFWGSHFQKILFRLIHPDKKSNDDFLNFWRMAYINQHGGTKKAKILMNAPAPFCYMFTVPQINYILAKYQLEDNKTLSAKQLWEWFRPIGVNITEETTQELYDNSIGDHRNMTVMGPARTVNVWGDVTQGDRVYILIKPISVDAQTTLRFRTTIDGQEHVVKNTANRDVIWQFCHHAGNLPSLTDLTTPSGVTGTFYKIGTVKDTFIENHAISLLSGFYKNPNDAESNVNRDEHAVTLLPAVNIFVDPVSPAYF